MGVFVLVGIISTVVLASTSTLHFSTLLKEHSCKIAAKAFAGISVLTLKRLSHPLIRLVLVTSGVVNQQQQQKKFKPWAGLDFLNGRIYQ